MSSPLAVKPKAKKNPKLAKSAMAVKRAGRMGDTELVHVNRDELAQMRQQWGEPTINPETGQPEFFLGFLKKLIAPVLSIAVPGLGTAIGGALGVGGTAGSILGNTALGTVGNLASGQSLGKSVLGGLTGAATGAAVNAAGSKLGSALAGTKPAATVAPQAAGTAPNVGTDRLASVSQATVNPALTQGSGAGNLVSTQGQPGVPQPKPNFWNQNFLGIKGLPNKYGIPLTALAVGALAGGGGGGDEGPPSQEQRDKFLDPVFKSSGRSPTGFYGSLDKAPTNSSGDPSRRPIEDYYRAGSRPEYAYFDYVKHLADGGPVADHPMAVKRGNHLEGEGDGRADTIPARLSDGEYVMDAESVALLGNGSNRAGADRLDSLRVNLRKHKGKALAKGKISPDAKDPAAYAKRRA